MNPSSSFLNCRVLVVDDNPAIHEDFRKILSKNAAPDGRLDDLESAILETQTQTVTHEGFEIDSAFQGEDGLARVQQAVDSGAPYALAFVDMRMPQGWDGVETIAQLGRPIRACRSSSARPIPTTHGSRSFSDWASAPISPC